MYKVEWKKEWPSILLLALMFIAGAVLFESIPERIPIHWNIRGEVDRYADKTIFTAFMLPLMSTGLFLLMLFLPYIDPRRKKYEKFSRVYRLIRVATIGLFCFVYGVILLEGLGIEINAGITIPAAVCVLFIILGNVMGKIRFNWFVGIRVPWTLADEDVWNKTHRFGGRIFVVAGLLGLGALFFSPVWTIVLLIAAGLIPIVYSAILYYYNGGVRA